MKRLLVCVLVGACCVGIGGCGSSALLTKTQAKTLAVAGAPTAAPESSNNGSGLAGPINDFGFDVLRALDAQADRQPQTVISPLSLHAGLAMIANGASAGTLAEMRKTLRLGSQTEEESNRGYSALLARLNSSTGATVAVGDSLWIDDGFEVKQAFLDADTRFFGAEIRELPLASPSALDAINAWATKATHGKIQQALDSAPDPSTQLIAVNATYFDGQWRTPFPPQETTTQAFSLPSGRVDVPMMRGHAADKYASGNGWEAASLPYIGTSSMVVILPSTSSSLDALETSITASGFSTILKQLQDKPEINLNMPRVEFRWDQHVVPELKTMGMHAVFDSSRADLTRMGSAPAGQLYLSDVIHDTYLRVDEKGTEAAAVTIGLVPATAWAGSSQPFVVNRPYLMAVVDNQSGAILFLAAVRDPRAGTD